MQVRGQWQRHWQAALLCGLSALLLVSCRQPPRGPDDPLVVGSSGTINTVDPAQATRVMEVQLISALGDRLYGINSQGEVVPRLATTLPQLSSDGLRAVIPLRRGVRFHDGTAFNADAMAFSLKRFLAIGKLSYVVGDRIVAVRVLDSHRLELQLKRPFSPLAKLLSLVNLTPISPTAYKQHQEGFRSNAFVGTGPYTLSYYSPQLQRLEPFPDYWDQAPRNPGIALVGMNTSTSLYGAIQGGSIDVLLSISLEPEQQSALHEQANQGLIREGAGPASGISFITLLSDRPPLDRLPLRQAVALSLDRELISERVTDGLRPALWGLVPPKLPGALSNWPKADLGAARTLLSQEGYCNGRVLKLELTYRSDVPADRLAALTWQELLRENLNDCLQLALQGMEATTAYSQLGSGAFQMIQLDWSGDFPDADNYLLILLGCSKREGDVCLEGDSAASGSFWAAPGLQQALDQSDEHSGTKRLALLHQVQRLAQAGTPYIPLWMMRNRAWATKRISTPSFDGSGLIRFAALQHQEQEQR